MYTYCDGAQLHYFGDDGIIYNGSKSYYLNRLQMFVFENCYGNNNDQLIDICLKKYNNGVQNEGLERAVTNCLKRLVEKGLVVYEQEGIRNIKISGEKGKYYPRKLSVELTDCCNLKCLFCYNESSQENRKFIDKEKLFELIEKVKGKTESIQLLGGEPLLHNDIGEILDTLTINFDTYITTNGILVNRIPVDKLKKLSGIVVSMYGYNEESFRMFTGSNMYQKFRDSLYYLHENMIDYAVAITITQYNLPIIEKYIEELISLRATKVLFGLPMVLGRAVGSQVAFTLSEESVKEVTHRLKKLVVQYYGKISIEFWGNSKTKLVPLLPDEYKSYCYLCGGGLIDYTITCDQRIKPCGYLPSECCYRSLDDLDTIIAGKGWETLRREKIHIAEYMEKNRIDKNQICNLLL